MPEPRLQPGKVKNSKFAAKEIFRSLKNFRLQISISILLCIGSAVLGIFSPKILGEMTDIAKATYSTGLDWTLLSQKTGIVAALFVGSALLNYMQAFLLATVSAKYTQKIRQQIIEKISRLPISYFDQHKYGDILSRMTNDVDVITTTLSQEIADISLSLTTLVGVMVIMLTISVPLSLIAFIVVPFSIIVVGKITKYAQKYFRSQRETLGELNGRIEEYYSGQIIVKSNSYVPTAISNFNLTNERLTKVSKKARIFSSLSIPVTHIFTSLSYVAICIVGGIQAVNGKITIGGIQAFIQYVSRFNRPITEIASATSTIQSILAASERVFEFLNEPEEEPDPKEPLSIKKIKGAVSFHNVNFSYDKKTPIIKNFSVDVKPGQKVAIVGPTGAGKTTIVNLLMRFYEPDSGYITIDGVPTKEMKRGEVRSLFGMVLQDTWLFSGTVEDNLRYGKLKATKEEIRQAAKASNVNHVIESLSEEYQTKIAEDSDNISAGEKQLLTIARAMVSNPPMMILDEATSNVDTLTEQLIQSAFEKLTKGRTSFVIAHRLSTIRNSDLILVMRDGNIVEQGNHEELMKKNGFYAELYNTQFAEE